MAQHDHHHDHDHDHQQVKITRVNAAFTVSIVLNLLYVAIEAVMGFYEHSLSLLSDAGHNLADVATLALALLAFRLLKVRANRSYTYGYRKTSILIALFNALLLVASVGVILYEAVQRFVHPEPTPGKVIAIVAAIGIVVNSVTALLFLRSKDKDINIKSAYLHLLSDALVSLGVVIGGIVIFYTQWFWIDSALSIVIASVILYSTWGILRDSLRLSLDGVPPGTSLENIKEAASKIPGIRNIYHIHVWAISSTENALTAHLVLEDSVAINEEQEIKHRLKHALLHSNIHHATLETERVSTASDAKFC